MLSFSDSHLSGEPLSTQLLSDTGLLLRSPHYRFDPEERSRANFRNPVSSLYNAIGIPK